MKRCDFFSLSSTVGVDYLIDPFIIVAYQYILLNCENYYPALAALSLVNKTQDAHKTAYM